jgi:uncharacterized glyoxalase superfamily protein PhnB
MYDSPKGWPRISSALYYEDAPAAIEWLGKAFGFRTRLEVEGGDGTIVHSEIELGDGLVMVASPTEPWRKSPRSLGGANTQSLFVYVDDVDAHCARARAAGARILTEPSNRDYGEFEDRTYGAEDCEGHRWWFGQRVRGGAA